MQDTETCLQAVRERDARHDGQFYYSVATTGVYCHPSCKARPALRQNMAFHASRAAAEGAGFRPCKRCRPDLAPRAEREAAVVATACRCIAAAEEVPSLAALAAQAGLSAQHFHRLFRRVAGVTPASYARAHRAAQVRQHLSNGASVTQALYDGGFNSSGRFYEAAPGMLGMTPGAFRAGGRGEAIGYAFGQSTLGLVLVAGSGRGICAILLGEDAAVLIAGLRARFPAASVSEAEPGFAEMVSRVVAAVDRPSEAHGLPLDIRGTAFQQRVWEVLRTIPAGETLSYAQVAARLGSPAAVRAVAGACAANKLAVVVPCHRVVASDGALAGYRWGLARKQALLAQEGE